MNEKYPNLDIETPEKILWTAQNILKAPNLRKYPPACQPTCCKLPFPSPKRDDTRSMEPDLHGQFLHKQKKKTNMGSWKILTIWRCISYWNMVNFPACHVRFRDCTLKMVLLMKAALPFECIIPTPSYNHERRLPTTNLKWFAKFLTFFSSFCWRTLLKVGTHIWVFPKIGVPPNHQFL